MISQETRAAFESITEILRRVSSDAKKRDQTKWSRDNLNLSKAMIERIGLSVDELDFQLQMVNLNDIGNLVKIIRECYLSQIDFMITCLEQQRAIPADIPMEYVSSYKNKDELKQKTLFGGSEVHFLKPFSKSFNRKDPYSKLVNEFVQQQPEEPKKNYTSPDRVDLDKLKDQQNRKKRIFKQVESRGTDTSEDVRQLLSTIFVTEKQSELAQIQHNTELNLLELEKIIKLKSLWQRVEPSTAQYKLNELTKRLMRGNHQAEQFINEQLKIFGIQEKTEQPNYDLIQSGIRETIEVVQNQSVKKIISAAEMKMKDILQNRLLKGVRSQQGQLIQQNSIKGRRPFSKMEDLENIIIAKNVELEKKESQVNKLYEKFNQNEKKFNELLDQLETYKQRILSIENQSQDHFTSHKNNSGTFDVGFQVYQPDKLVFQVQDQLIMYKKENDHLKQLIFEIKKDAEDAKKQNAKPGSTEEALILILQSDFPSEVKVDLTRELMTYMKNDPEEFKKKSGKEIFLWIKAKIMKKGEGQDEFDFLNDNNLDEYQQFQMLKKKIKQFKGQMNDSPDQTANTPSNFNRPLLSRNESSRNLDFKSQADRAASQFSRESFNKNQLKTEEDMRGSQKSKLGGAGTPQLKQIMENGHPQSRGGHGQSPVPGSAFFTFQAPNNNGSLGQQSQAGSQIGANSQYLDNNERQHSSNTPSLSQLPSIPTNIWNNPSNNQQTSCQTSIQVTPQNQVVNINQNSYATSGTYQGPNPNTISSAFSQYGTPNNFIGNQSIPLTIEVHTQDNNLIVRDSYTPLHIVKNTTQPIIEEETLISPSSQTQSKQSTKREKSLKKPLQLSSLQGNPESQKQSRSNTRIPHISSQNTMASNEKSPIGTPIQNGNRQQVQRGIKVIQTQNVSPDASSSKHSIDSKKFRFASNELLGKKNSKDLQHISESESYKAHERLDSSKGESPLKPMRYPQEDYFDTKESIQHQDKDTQTEVILLQQYVESLTRKLNLSSEQIAKLNDIFIHASQTQSTLSDLNYIYEDSNRNKSQHQVSSNQSTQYQIGFGKTAQLTSPSQRRLNDLLSKTRTNREPEFDIDLNEYQDEQTFETLAMKDNGGKQFEVVQDKDVNQEWFIKKLFKNLNVRQNHKWTQDLTLIINKYNLKPSESAVSYDEFMLFFKKLLASHNICGQECIHLKRFFNKFGFTTTTFSKKRQLNPIKQQMRPFGNQTKRFNEKSYEKY